MTQNPYAAPDSSDNSSPRDLISRNGKRLNTLSRITVVSCSLWFLLMIVARFYDENAPPLAEMMGFYTFMGLAPGFGLFGALSALKRRHYAISVVGALSTSLPIFGPWCGLMIPIGIWSVVLLRRPDVRESFASAATVGCSDSDSADDAMARASRLDATGDWEAAISAYREAADRWPEHSTYISNCIAEIARKQSGA